MSGTQPGLSLTGRTLKAPKGGNTEAEYEDAYDAVRDVTSPRQRFTVAVADGASSAVFARDWALMLVHDFARNPASSDVWKRIALLGQKWRERVSQSDLPWYAQEKIQSGSSATLLVVTWDLEAKTWKAHAVGDSCLVLIRGGKIAKSFPVSTPEGFDNSPDLLPTEVLAFARAKALPKWKECRGDIQVGDRFLLLTDAVASWLLSAAARGEKPWEALPEDNDAMAPWLESLRAEGAMRNDDVTVVEIEVIGQ